MKWIPLFFILFSIAQAQHFDAGVLHVLEEANQQKVLPNYSQNICSAFVSASATDDKKSQSNPRDLNECAVALCGDPAENTSVYLNDQNFNQYISPDINNKIGKLSPKIEKMFDLVQKNAAKKTKDYSNALLKDGKLNLKENEWSDLFKQSLSNDIFSPYLETTIDLKKPFDERIKIKIVNDANLSPEFKKNLQSYAEQNERYQKTNYLMFLRNGLYSHDELKTIAQNKIQKLKEEIKNQKNLKPEITKMISADLEECEKELSQPDDPANDFALTLTRLDYIDGTLSSEVPGRAPSSPPPVCNDAKECSAIYANYINQQKVMEALNNFSKDLTNDTKKREAINRCKASMVASLSDVSDQLKAQKLVEEVKAQMQANVFRKFSEHSSKILKDYFAKKIKTSSESPLKVLQGLDPLKSLAQRTDAYLSQKGMEFSVNQEQAIQDLLQIAAKNDFDAYEDYGVPCGGSSVSSNAWDTYLAYDRFNKIPEEQRKQLKKIPPTDHIFISDFTCHHDLRGKSVVAHELGHAINQIFASLKLSTESAKKYKDLRKCATDSYVNPPADTTMFATPGDGVYTEEDTADLFSYMTYNDPKNLFTCALLKSSISKHNYAELSVLANEGDTHSTSFYRLIMEAINKGVELPVSCERSLEPMKNQLRLKKCAL